jgi:DNA-binding transcriptional MocR family regulator
LAATLSSCASPATRTGAPTLRVKLSTACERLLAPVALPPALATDKAREAFVKDDAALIAAQREVARARKCLAQQRALYAAQRKK